jgi:hypothetical protein
MQQQATTSTQPNTTPTAVRYPLGQLCATPGALEALTEARQSAQEFFNRHARLEQGELCDIDHKANLVSVNKPLRIFSAFKTARGVKLWIITEADRSVTTVLLPDEY